jgi:cytochrome b561
MLIRLAWRLGNPVPRLPETLEPWQQKLARANHWLFYLLLIGMPFSGYLLVSAHGRAHSDQDSDNLISCNSWRREVLTRY